MITVFLFATQELEAHLKRSYDNKAKLREPKDLEDHDSEKSKCIVARQNKKTH